MSRKHYSQFNVTETAFIHGYIRANAAKVTGAEHFYDRASERTFDISQAVDTLANGRVIEVHNDRSPRIRALVRRQSGPNSGTNVVVDLMDWHVVTVYYNSPSDTHDTLNWSPYRWQVNVVNLVKSLRGEKCK
ncbi:Uncharacterised protein [uncultured archaeon]|nr:Uncharacterised protein [uncultured archaeon]